MTETEKFEPGDVVECVPGCVVTLKPIDECEDVIASTGVIPVEPYRDAWRHPSWEIWKRHFGDWFYVKGYEHSLHYSWFSTITPPPEDSDIKPPEETQQDAEEASGLDEAVRECIAARIGLDNARERDATAREIVQDMLAEEGAPESVFCAGHVVFLDEGIITIKKCEAVLS